MDLPLSPWQESKKINTSVNNSIQVLDIETANAQLQDMCIHNNKKYAYIYI